MRLSELGGRCTHCWFLREPGLEFRLVFLDTIRTLGCFCCRQYSAVPMCKGIKTEIMWIALRSAAFWAPLTSQSHNPPMGHCEPVISHHPLCALIQWAVKDVYKCPGLQTCRGQLCVWAFVHRSLQVVQHDTEDRETADNSDRNCTLPVYCQVAVVLCLLLLLTIVSLFPPSDCFLHLVSFSMYLDYKLQRGEALVSSLIVCAALWGPALAGASRHCPSVNNT